LPRSSLSVGRSGALRHAAIAVRPALHLYSGLFARHMRQSRGRVRWTLSQRLWPRPR
jgi:hypothetical protein